MILKSRDGSPYGHTITVANVSTLGHSRDGSPWAGIVGEGVPPVATGHIKRICGVDWSHIKKFAGVEQAHIKEASGVEA